MIICKAELHIQPDKLEHADVRVTMTCTLDADHKGPHEERYPRGDNKSTVIVMWEGDDRRLGLGKETKP